MHTEIIRVADGFWNLRGSFKIGGLLDIGTHVSLVRRRNGKFVFLDSYPLGGREEKEIDELTGGGKNVEAILNLHPFHTIHVLRMHERYPHARLHGTARHVAKFPDLPWEDARTEQPALHAMFADDLEFSVPRGVDLVSADENVHFSSVLALHGASKTIHVDDTLMYFRLPKLMRWFGLADALRFHPTLARALEKRAGAAGDFRAWAQELIERWGAAENLCAAHAATLTAGENRGASIPARMIKALAGTDATLRAHQRKYG